MSVSLIIGIAFAIFYFILMSSEIQGSDPKEHGKKTTGDTVGIFLGSVMLGIASVIMFPVMVVSLVINFLFGNK